jgi:hypothetical protein
MGKKSGSGMNNQHHVSVSLVTIFWVKILKFFVAVMGSGIREGKSSDPGWKNSDLGSGINITDPQHCITKHMF